MALKSREAGWPHHLPSRSPWSFASLRFSRLLSSTERAVANISYSGCTFHWVIWMHDMSSLFIVLPHFLTEPNMNWNNSHDHSNQFLVEWSLFCILKEAVRCESKEKWVYHDGCGICWPSLADLFSAFSRLKMVDHQLCCINRKGHQSAAHMWASQSLPKFPVTVSNSFVVTSLRSNFTELGGLKLSGSDEEATVCAGHKWALFVAATSRLQISATPQA